MPVENLEGCQKHLEMTATVYAGQPLQVSDVQVSRVHLSEWTFLAAAGEKPWFGVWRPRTKRVLGRSRPLTSFIKRRPLQTGCYEKSAREVRT
jgi:hypothetical protein